MINYDYINEYIRNTIKKDEGFLLELRRYAEDNHVPIVHPEVARFITVLGSILKPSRILEVGTAIGYSSILFSHVLAPGGIIDTIESNDVMAELARKNVRMAGCKDVINVIEGDAMDILPYLEKKYNFIFLDAAKGQYPEFFPFCFRLLNAGGILVSDNVLYKGMVANDALVVRRKKTIVRRLREYLHDICNNPCLETSILPIGDGVAVSYYSGMNPDDHSTTAIIEDRSISTIFIDNKTGDDNGKN